MGNGVDTRDAPTLPRLPSTDIEDRTSGNEPHQDELGLLKNNAIDELGLLKHSDTSDENSDTLPTTRRRRPKFTTPYLRRDCSKVLNEWFSANLDRPYPSAEEKLELERKSVRFAALPSDSTAGSSAIPVLHYCQIPRLCKLRKLNRKYRSAGGHAHTNTQLVSQR